MTATKPALIVTACAALLFAVGALGAAESSDKVSEIRDVETFKRIVTKGSVDVTVKIGSPQSVEVTAKERIMDKVETTVDNGTLTIKLKRGSYRSHGAISADITVAALEGLSISGSGDADISGVDSEVLVFKISGSGDIRADGACGDLTVKISGSGDIDTKELHCVNAEVGISGSGDADVYASAEFSGKISGSGDIGLYGGARMQQVSVAGSGDISSY